MKGALKAINEDKPDALATAIESVEDLNAVFFYFFGVPFVLPRNHCCILLSRRARSRFPPSCLRKVPIRTRSAL
jgi:hypothetical protein